MWGGDKQKRNPSSQLVTDAGRPFSKWFIRSAASCCAAFCEALKDQAEVRRRQRQKSVSCSELGLGNDPASGFLGDAG